MGKIRVQDLSKMMGIPNQDLIFKLKSIGVRVEGDDAHIDTDTLQAIMQGKRLPHPREVILRDGETQPAPANAPRGRQPMPRRAPPAPPRPNRPRTIIRKVDTKIRSMPVTEKPKREEAPPAVKPAAAEAKPTTAKSTKPAPEPGNKRDRRDKAKEQRGHGKPAQAEEVDLRAFEGEVGDIEAEADAAVQPAPMQRPPKKARAERRKEKRQSKTGDGLQLAQSESAGGPVLVSEHMTVRDFAEKLGVKAKDLISHLFQRGVMANINHVLDTETALALAEDLGVEAMEVTFEEEVQLQEEESMTDTPSNEGTDPRAPVVTIMGHVDHGKTSLLDALRESNVTDSEFGGITQHIGAYEVHRDGTKLVFLDTPGHEAFTMMRARGAKATDLVVLVVAADDGVMPQTIEAIDHARAANVPIVVAINKIDKANANPDRVKKELADNNLLVEDWGGEVVSVPISALKKEGIDELLEMITITADLLELKANPELSAQGVVLEARKETGRGIVATVLVQNGSLNVGDSFVTGSIAGRVRSMVNDHGARMDSASPSTPVEVTGFGDVPEAGDPFQVVDDESKARQIAKLRSDAQRSRELAAGPGKISLDDLFSRIQHGEAKDLNVVLKADVQGSVEVLKDTLAKLGTDKVRVQTIHSAVGPISTNDVMLAVASQAIIIGFNVRPERNASTLAEKEGVDIRLHTVIYELTDELRKAMTGLLDPTFQEVTKGRAEVREVFKVPKMGVVAGSHVIDGVIPRNALARLLRDNVVVYDGKIGSLRRFKDDVAEVRNGFDCGIGLDRYQDVKPGDEIEAYVREEVAATL